MPLRGSVVAILLLAGNLLPGQESTLLEPRYDRGLIFASSDGQTEIKLQGRIHLHLTHWQHDDTIEASTFAGDDGFYFRRARIKISGKLNDRVRFKLQPDFSSGNTRIDTAHIRLDGLLHTGSFKVGKLNEPFGLDTLTSANDSLFVERSSGKDAISPDKNIGFLTGNTFENKQGTWAFGGFRDSTGNEGDSIGDQDLSWTGRLTWLPVDNKAKDQLLHLGIAGSLRKPPGGEARLSARPEVRPSEKLLDTQVISGVNAMNLVGLEAAWFDGPFSLQGEQMFATLERDSQSNPRFSHFYIAAAYSLTGEHPGYSRSKGVPSGLKPLEKWGLAGGRGALQLVGRYSHTDLEDDGISGGVLDQITLGLNWVLDPATRVQLDHLWIDSQPVAGTPIEGSSRALAMRFQVTF